MAGQTHAVALDEAFGIIWCDYWSRCVRGPESHGACGCIPETDVCEFVNLYDQRTFNSFCDKIVRGTSASPDTVGVMEVAVYVFHGRLTVGDWAIVLSVGPGDEHGY